MIDDIPKQDYGNILRSVYAKTSLSMLLLLVMWFIVKHMGMDVSVYMVCYYCSYFLVCNKVSLLSPQTSKRKGRTGESFAPSTIR